MVEHQDSPSQTGPLSRLYHQLASGQIDRRAFLGASAALGVSSAVASMLALTGAATASGQKLRNGFAFVAQASPEASPQTDALVGEAPSFDTDHQERGAGGTLKLIIWQAPTVAAPHSALSTKDYIAAAPVIEPIMQYLPDGSLVANLVEQVPTVENGLLTEDLTSATFVFLENLVWSDGEPVTADDLIFTWKWVMEPTNAATSAGVWQAIQSIDAVDTRTAKVTFKKPSVTWFEPFSGGFDGNLYPAHIFDNDPKNKNEQFMNAPIGTGPYVMESFNPNDSASYVVNEKYREPNKPFFSRIELKGGGDAAAAARSVLQTGEYDYAWNLQVEPQVLSEMEGTGEHGHVFAVNSTDVESINFNFSDPHRVVDGQKSQKDTPNPVFSDIAVRRALNLAVPRQEIADQFYTEDEHPTANLLAGMALYESPNTSWAFDIGKANDILDDAGWVLENGIRSKDGVKLSFDYWTSITTVRQKTQAVVKDTFSQLGATVELQAVDSSIFFDSGAGNDQNFYHMFWDMDMWTNGPYSPIPITYLNRWYAGPNGENIAQKENDWQKDNTQRYQNPEFDALYEELVNATDTDQAIDLLIQANDMLIADVVAIPIVNRAVGSYALANRIRNDNLANGPSFIVPTWNIANWNLNDGFEPEG